MLELLSSNDASFRVSRCYRSTRLSEAWTFMSHSDSKCSANKKRSGPTSKDKYLTLQPHPAHHSPDSIEINSTQFSFSQIRDQIPILELPNHNGRDTTPSLLWD